MPELHNLHNNVLKLVSNSVGSIHRLHLHVKNFDSFKCFWRMAVPPRVCVYEIYSKSPFLISTVVLADILINIAFN